jgi:hypothetical protein
VEGARKFYHEFNRLAMTGALKRTRIGQVSANADEQFNRTLGAMLVTRQNHRTATMEARREWRERRRRSEALLPTLLPLRTKNSPKQHRFRANKRNHVIEI